jgi:hypothetical protein
LRNLPYYRLFFDKSNKLSIKLETEVTWSKSNLNMKNIYEESTLNFWICQYFYLYLLSKFKYFCFVTILNMSLVSRSCKNDHIIFNVGTPSLEARNIRLVNIITEYLWGKYPQFLDMPIFLSLSTLPFAIYLRIDRNFCPVHEEIISIRFYTPCNRVAGYEIQCVRQWFENSAKFFFCQNSNIFVLLRF